MHSQGPQQSEHDNGGMSSELSAQSSVRTYRERLIPGPAIFIACLLLLPAVSLILIPVNASIAIPTAVIVYVIVAASLLLLSPTVSVSGKRLTAGRAAISVDQLGAVEPLGSEALRTAIGPGLDARTFMLVRGWIHRGVRIDNTDPSDPAPHWIITTRHPSKLAAAIAAAQAL